MQALKELRKQLGLSHVDFANLIGCKAAQLAMAESKGRQLSAKNYLELSILQTHTEKIVEAKNKQAAPIQNITISNMLEKSIKTTKIKLVRQQIKQEDLKSKKTAAENLLAYTAIALQVNDLAELTQMHLTVLQRQASEKINRYHQNILNCELQIAGLEAIISTALLLKNI